jgi:hypothetical protein
MAQSRPNLLAAREAARHGPPQLRLWAQAVQNAEFFRWARKNISAISPTGPAIADIQANAK